MPISEFIYMLKSDLKMVFKGTHMGFTVYQTERNWKELAKDLQIESGLVFDYIKKTVKIKECR